MVKRFFTPLSVLLMAVAVAAQNYENEVLKYKSTFSYEFDQQGNWIERVKLTVDREQKTPGPHFKEVTVRRIEYHDGN